MRRAQLGHFDPTIFLVLYYAAIAGGVTLLIGALIMLLKFVRWLQK